MGPWRLDPPALDKSVLSGALHWPTRLRHAELHQAAQCRQHGQGTPAWCQGRPAPLPKRGRPSATTSSLRPSSAGCGTPRSESRTKTLVVDPCTCFPAHFGRGHLHREATSRKQTRPWTRCAMVAKGVQRAVTATDGNTRRERQAETAKQQQAEQVRLDASVKARWRSGQSSTGHGTALRPQLVSRKWRSTREAASCCQPVRHPPGSSNGGGGARTSNQSGPRWWFEPHHARQIPTATPLLPPRKLDPHLSLKPPRKTLQSLGVSS